MPSPLSRISVRLLAFNLLLVFLPVAGLLYLPTHERQLLEAQERAMVQQARLLSAALSERGELGPEAAEPLLQNLRQRTDARLRVVDRYGTLLADSSRMGPRLEPGAEPAGAVSELRSAPLYRLGAALGRLVTRTLRPPLPAGDPAEFYGSEDVLRGPEIRAALDGRYGAATRISPAGQRSVTLYSAIPVRSGGEVVGAVLVSQSTARILESLYEVRLGIFRVFLASVGVAAVLTLLLSTTISAPLRRLARQARVLPDRRGRLQRDFSGSRRRDEIGDLARALEALSRRLERHLRFIESFASDVSHELKNPLASVRGATELLGQQASPEERRRFLSLIEREVSRMERLLSEVREVARIDARLDEEERRSVDWDRLTEQTVEGFRIARRPTTQIVYRGSGKPAPVDTSPERLTQMVENLLDNAVGFSPDGSAVEVGLSAGAREHRLTVADRGPGIPPQNLERVFDRFYSQRPEPGDPDRREHSGLGLSIVRTLAEGYGGSASAANREGGGAVFEIRLPAAANPIE